MGKRLYVVTVLARQAQETGTEGAPRTKLIVSTRLVNAINRQQALRFVSKDHIETKIAKPHEVAELVGSGLRVEEAGQ